MELEESHFLGDLDAIDIDVTVRAGRLVARLDEMTVDHCGQHMAGLHQHLHLRIDIAIDDQFVDLLYSSKGNAATRCFSLQEYTVLHFGVSPADVIGVFHRNGGFRIHHL